MTNDSNNNTITFIFFAALATLLIAAAIVIMLWVQNLSYGGGSVFSLETGRREKIAGAPHGAADENAAQPATSQAAAPTDADLDAVIAAINKGGCTACHTIPGIPGAVGQVGPDLSNIGVDGATRREGYSATEYIHESIVEPGSFTAPECPFGPCVAGTMPNIVLDNAEIELIVAYLSTLGVGN